jgi:hypothetical protein
MKNLINGTAIVLGVEQMKRRIGTTLVQWTLPSTESAVKCVTLTLQVNNIFKILQFFNKLLSILVGIESFWDH